jgi:diaminopimelate epimerase
VGKVQGLLDGDVRVDLPGGTATVTWESADQPLWLTGPATTVFQGSIDLPRFTGAKQ